MKNNIIHPEALELAELLSLKPRWEEALEQLHRSGVLLNAGDADDDAAGDGDEEVVDDDAGDEEVIDDDASGDDEEDDRFIKVDKDEYNRLKREAADTAKRARVAERAAKKQRDKDRRDAGQFDEMLAEKDEERDASAARAEAAEYQLDQFQRRNRITAAATRLGFKDPEDAIAFLHEDDTEDDVSTERALKRLAREKQYLVDTRRSSGAPINGEQGATLTNEDIKNMSQDEINARWEEVQQALSQGTS